MISWIASRAAWGWRSVVPFAWVGDRLAHRLAPEEGEPAGLVGRVARAWMGAAGPERQAELRLDDRLQAANPPDHPGVAAARQQEDLAALERALSQPHSRLPPDDPLPAYQPIVADLPQLFQSQHLAMARFCDRAALHGAMGAALVLGARHSGIGPAELMTCLRSAIAGLPRWDGSLRANQAALVAAPEQGLGERAETLFFQMLKCKRVGWAGRVQARLVFKSVGPLLDHVLPRLGGRILNELHTLGDSAQLGQFLTGMRGILHVAAHHFSQINRIQNWAAAQQPFFDEASGEQEGPLADGAALLERELSKATYHGELDWAEASRWCHRFIADRWCSHLFGFSEKLETWMRPSDTSQGLTAPPQGAARIWFLFQRALFYLRLPLVALCVFILRLIENWILNPLARFAILKVLNSQNALEQGLQAVLRELRPAPALGREGDSVVTLRGYSYVLDQGLRSLYRMVRQLLIYYREAPAPPIEQLQRLRDGSRLRLELDEDLQRTAGQLARNLLEMVERMPRGVGRARRALLSQVRRWAPIDQYATQGVRRLFTLVAHDPLLRHQASDSLITGLEALYSLDPEPSLTEIREMHQLQKLSRAWMLRELRESVGHGIRCAVRGDDQLALEQELAHFHRQLLDALPLMPAELPQRLRWFQEIQRVVPLWDQEMRSLSLREQVETELGDRHPSGQVYLEIDRLLKRVQILLRVHQTSEEGQRAHLELSQRRLPSSTSLQTWRAGFQSRVNQMQALAARLTRFTPAPLRSGLDQSCAVLRRLSTCMQSMHQRLDREGAQEQLCSQQYQAWSQWRRGWQGSVRAVREAEQAVRRAQGVQRSEAQTRLRNLRLEHASLLKELAPPTDPEGRWQRLRVRNPSELFADRSVEELLRLGSNQESELALALDRFHVKRSQEACLAKGMELCLLGLIRDVTAKGAFEPPREHPEPWKRVGELALLLAEQSGAALGSRFEPVRSFFERHHLPIPQEVERGCVEESALLADRQDWLQLLHFWNRQNSIPDLPLYGPRWQAPPAWRQAALSLQRRAPQFFSPALLEQGDAALESWRALFPRAREVAACCQERSQQLETRLIQAQAPLLPLGTQLCADSLRSAEVQEAQSTQTGVLQSSMGQLIARLQQLRPLCQARVPGPVRSWLHRQLASGGAALGQMVSGIETMGDHLIDTLMSPAHVRGVLQEVVTRVGAAYARSESAQIQCPRHRALRDGVRRPN